MDAFSFLKYWRRADSDTAAFFTKDPSTHTYSSSSSSSSSSANTTTIVTAVEDHDGDHDDDGSLFDLEFSLPEDDNDDSVVVALEKGTDEARTSGEIISENPSQELVINLGGPDNDGDGLRSADSTTDFNVKGHMESSNSDTKFNASGVMKSATKLGVLMFNLKKCKSNVSEKSAKSEAGEDKAQPEQKQQHKHFMLNLKAEEIPVLPLFTRDFSSKGETKRNNVLVETIDSNQCSSPDKKIGKDVVNKYLKKVKPLYIRVSKRYGEKLGFSLHLTEEVKSQPEKTVSPKAAGMEQSNVKNLKQGNLQAGLRLVYKQLGKSQSTSSATVSDVPAAPATLNRRDDSLLQQEDGIQSAILHCKRSFNASQRYEGSHPHEKSVHPMSIT